MAEANASLNDWIRNSPADEFWFWAVVFLVITLICFFLAFHYLHRKRLIQDTPTSKVRSAAQGYLELVGHGELMDGLPIIAPLTGTHCTWYQFRVEEKRQSGKRTEWKTIRQGISDDLFLLKDETGECVIDPEGASVTVRTSDIWYGGSASPSAMPGRNKPRALFSSGRFRYTEKRLHPGEALYAIGLFKTVGGSGAKLDVETDVRELIREWKRDSEEMLKRFDLNKDGEIDMEEWQQVRDEAFQHIVEKHKEQQTMPPVHLMNKTRDKRRPYILSAVPQDELTGRLHTYAMLAFITFVIFGVLATWTISLRLAS